MPANTLSEVVLVLAPFGRDAALATRILADAGIEAEACRDVPQMIERMGRGAGAALVTEQALDGDLAPLSYWFAGQPSWSDFPMVLLTQRGGGSEQNPQALRLMDLIGNITFLERPFHPTTLVSIVKAALRSRRRQYEIRTHLYELEDSAAALTQSEERRRVAVEGAGIGTWDFYPDSGSLIWDPVCRRLFGFPERGDIDLATCMALVHPDDRERVSIAVTEAIEPSFTGIYQTEFRLADTGAGERWLGVFGKLYRAGKSDRRLAGSALDITDRKNAEEGLRDRAETLEAEVEERTRERDSMWQLSSELLLVAQFDGQIVAANPSWERILGWTEVELRYRTLHELIHPDDMAETRAEVKRLSEGKTTFRFENRYRHRDGTYRWISWAAVPASGYVYATGRDITDERNTAEALREVEEQLRQAQKMEAVGQLTGGIAHDFNNLLAGISGSLEMTQLRVRQGRTDQLERYIDAAASSVQRAAALTHRLLAFSRRQTLDPKQTDVNDLIASMEDLVQRTTGPNIELATTLGTAVWPTRCDPHQLESALLNLCINARDAMPDGGRLFIETTNICLDEAYAATQAEVKPGEYVAIRVTDTGSGMPPEVAARAFDPFFTTKPLGQGTGLGLSMVYGFTKQSGGHIRIYSEVGNGTTVSIFLPRDLSGIVPAHRDETPRDASYSGKGETILVVDDEALIRSLVVEALGDAGYAVLEAEDGPGALKILAANAQVRLLVTDVGLPRGMNGRQLADAARETMPRLKVLFMTGYAAHAAVENILVEPGTEILTKPFPIDTLTAKVQAMLLA